MIYQSSFPESILLKLTHTPPISDEFNPEGKVQFIDLRASLKMLAGHERI